MTTPGEERTERTGWPTPTAPMRTSYRWPVALVLVVLLTAAGGFLLGTRTNVAVHTGSPTSGEHVMTVMVDGWAYGIPEDLSWKDSSGSWHDRGRPDCIPPLASDIAPVTFGSVDVATPDGVGWRQVVWVICSP